MILALGSIWKPKQRQRGCQLTSFALIYSCISIISVYQIHDSYLTSMPIKYKKYKVRMVCLLYVYHTPQNIQKLFQHLPLNPKQCQKSQQQTPRKREYDGFQETIRFIIKRLKMTKYRQSVLWITYPKSNCSNWRWHAIFSIFYSIVLRIRSLHFLYRTIQWWQYFKSDL